ncbi:MAG: cadherin repeat domain-containing protein, partial [Bacteroidales bacterium]
GNSGSAFQINSGSGLIAVANTNALNFETNPAFNLTVRAQDNGPGNLFSEATITVNLSDVNEIPLISNQSFTISENTSNGTSVGTVVASDPDNGQTLTYSIISGNSQEVHFKSIRVQV